MRYTSPIIFIATLISTVLLAGCTQQTAAPIISATPYQQNEQSQSQAQTVPEPASPQPANTAAPASAVATTQQNTAIYVVKPGDSLSAIAANYNMSYIQLARLNEIPPPYHIFAGQKLIVPASSTNEIMPSQPTATPPPVTTQVTQPISASTPVKTAKVTATVSAPSVVQLPTKTKDGIAWSRPLPGQVVTGYQSKGNDNVILAGKTGETVYAAAAGQVIYAGIDIKGNGQMLIISCGKGIIAAYSQIKTILVKEGQQVSRGEAIARLGQHNLAFQIRRYGKPMDPENYLPS